MKSVHDNNIDSLVHQGDFIYFVTKDGKDKPLEDHSKFYQSLLMYF